MLKAECPECGYTIRLTKRWADLGLPFCPIDSTGLTLDVAGEMGGGEGVHVLAPAAARFS
jgi:hypothetical protein